MKSRVLITGTSMMTFGLINLFSYLLISFSPLFLNTPFPFEHLQIIFRDEGGITQQIGYMPIHEAMFDPYWLFWSLTLYAGVIVTGFVIWRIRK